MLFSVVIPVYNVKDYLEKCVDSVLAQDCGDYEIILVDDGSTDGVSPELCDRYALASPDRIRVIHQENQGLGGARNTGLEAARGEYLFFVDSDDRIVPHALSYLEGKIRVIHQENQGLGGARNTGLEAARGEYLFFVDSDDRIVPHALSYLEGKIRQTHADMYLFRLFYDRDGVLTPADPLRVPTDVVLHPAQCPELLLESPSASVRVCRRSLFLEGQIRVLTPADPLRVPTDVVLHPAQCPELLLESPSASVRVCRRSLFLEGQIRFPAGIWYEDLATTPKCLLHARSVVALSEPLYCYLLRDGSIMRNANLKRNLEILDVLGSVRAYYESNGVLEQYRDVLCYLAVVRDGSIMRNANLKRNLEILDVLGSVRAYYESNGVLEQYRDVLCYLAVDNALMAAQRVLMGDPNADYLPLFLQTVAQDYPDYRQNPLLPGLGKRKMLVLSLLERRRYGTIRFLFSTLHTLRGQRTKKK